MLRHLRRLAKRVTGVERGHVGPRDRGFLGELPVQPLDRRSALAPVHPEQQSQRPHVAAQMRFARCEPVRFHGVGGELGDVEPEHLILRERIIVERVPRVSGLAQIALVERRRIHDDRAADSQIAQLDGEGGGIHRDEHVDRVAGVITSVPPKWIWNAETPNVVPVGARISAGKSGNVENRCRRAPSRA